MDDKASSLTRSDLIKLLNINKEELNEIYLGNFM